MHSRNWHVGGRDKEKCVWVWLRACVCDKWDYINCFSSVPTHGNTFFFHLDATEEFLVWSLGLKRRSLYSRNKLCDNRRFCRDRVQTHPYFEIRECVSVLVFCVWSLDARFVECGCCFLISFVDITKKKKKAKSDLRQRDRRIKYGSVWGLHTCNEW